MIVCYIGTITCVQAIIFSRLKVCKFTYSSQGSNKFVKILFIVRIIYAKFESVLFVLVESKHLNCAPLLGCNI